MKTFGVNVELRPCSRKPVGRMNEFQHLCVIHTPNRRHGDPLQTVWPYLQLCCRQRWCQSLSQQDALFCAAAVICCPELTELTELCC